MDVCQKKEQFSKAFVCALAAQAGLRSCEPSVDDDSTDIILKGKGYSSSIRNPQIEIQLKCTENDEGNNEVFKFPLKLKNYNDLRGKNLLCPRYLFVLIVPKDYKSWLIHFPSASLLSHYCYWVSLRDMPHTPNVSSVTIDIPRLQRVTLESILDLMEMAANIREIA